MGEPIYIRGRKMRPLNRKFEEDGKIYEIRNEYVPDDTEEPLPVEITDPWYKAQDASRSPNHRKRSNLTRQAASGRVARNNK
jgi:hypothetical protein